VRTVTNYHHTSDQNVYKPVVLHPAFTTIKKKLDEV